jgi:glutathione synthase/RimK-type ligase-like ATP-grasp enzyme
MRVGHNWLDEHGKLITREEVRRRIKAESEVVLKRAVFSEGGFGVHFISGEDIFTEFRKVLRKIPTDVIIQKPIKQHRDMAALNASSVNTLRIMSWLDGSEVKILCTAVRIGVGGDRVDNISHGGLFCGVRSDGSITNGFLHGAIETDRHPEHGYLFSEVKIPSLDKAYELVKNAHPAISHFRIAGWDVAIDEDGEPTLIEVNFSLCCVNDIQSVCGPLFGDDTKKMLDEVFKGKKAQFTVLV